MSRTPLLISGSRRINRAGLAYAEKCVRRAKERGDMYVVVGDAKGIDSHVIAICNAIGLDYFCYGIDSEPRCTTAKTYICLEETIVARTRKEAFRQRDLLMLDHVRKNNGRVMCISNGNYDGGTAQVYKYGLLYNVPSDMKIFGK